MLLSDIRTAIRQRTDTENDPHITDAELTSYINSSAAELYGIVTSTFEDYNVTSLVFTLSSGSDGYALPSDFYKILRLDRSSSGSSTANDWYRIRRGSFADMPNSGLRGYASLYGYGYQSSYKVFGGKLYIEPVSQIAGTYRLWYYPAYKDLVNDSDMFAIGPTGQHWEEYVIADVGIKVAVKDETDPSAFQMAKAQLVQRIQSEASNRDAGDTEPLARHRIPWYERNGWGC